MGVFNRVKIDNEIYQTKALDLDISEMRVLDEVDLFTELDVIEPGQKVVLSRKSQNSEEYALAPSHTYNPQPTNYSVSIVRERDGQEFFVKINNNRLTNIFEKDEENCFKHNGISIGTKTWEPEIKEDEIWTEIKNMVN